MTHTPTESEKFSVAMFCCYCGEAFETIPEHFDYCEKHRSCSECGSGFIAFYNYRPPGQREWRCMSCLYYHRDSGAVAVKKNIRARPQTKK